MKLFAINGSPRGKGSNTYRMAAPFIEGFTSVPGNEAEAVHVQHQTRLMRSYDRIAESDLILLAFPIYFHSMPGQMKEAMESLPHAARPGQAMVFLIQCGFPDTAQCRPIERYAAKWAERKGYRVYGIIVKGFGPSLEAMPPGMNTKWLKTIQTLGHCAGSGLPFPEPMLEELRAPRTFSPGLLLFMRILAALGIMDLYTRKRLRDNHVKLRDSYAKPLLEKREDNRDAKTEGRGAADSPR